MRSRTVLTVLLAIAVLCGGLLAAPPGLPMGPTPALSAELNYLSVARGEPRRQAILGGIADFEKAHPGVKVMLSEIPFDQYFQKVAIALASGSGIDVFDVDSPLVASYGYQGALLPLDKYYSQQNWNDFTEVERRIAVYKGKKLSAPMSSTSVDLFYNIDLFKQAGLPLPGTEPSDRMTWDRVVDLSKKIMEKLPGVWGFAVSQYDRPYEMLPLIESMGAGDLSPDGATVNGYLNSPEAIAAARWYGDTFNTFKISPREQIPNLFYTGKLAMYLAPSYEANTLKSQYPDVKWAVAPHPFFKKPVTPTGAWHVGVFSGSKEPDLAAELLKAYTDPEAAKRNYTIMNYMPVRLSTFKAFPETFEANPNKLFYWEIIHTAVTRPRTPAYREYEDLLRQAFANIRQGADPAKEMNAAVQKIDAQLRRFR